MITISHLPCYRDSETFASRFWRPMCFTGWLHLGSSFSVFEVQPLISLVFLNIFYCSNFQMTCERSYNWNAWLISSPACSWFGFNKKLRFTAGVTSEKLQSRPIMTKLDPTQPSHMHSSMHFSFYLLIRHSKNENIKYIEKCQRYKRLNRKNRDIWA